MTPSKHQCTILAVGRTSKVTPPPWYKEGAGVDGTPLGFRYVQYFEKISPLVEKPAMSSTR